MTQLGLNQYVDQPNPEFSGILLSQHPTGVSHCTQLRVYFLIYTFSLVKMGEATKINSVNSVYMLT